MVNIDIHSWVEELCGLAIFVEVVVVDVLVMH